MATSLSLIEVRTGKNSFSSQKSFNQALLLGMRMVTPMEGGGSLSSKPASWMPHLVMEAAEKVPPNASMKVAPSGH